MHYERLHIKWYNMTLVLAIEVAYAVILILGVAFFVFLIPRSHAAILGPLARELGREVEVSFLRFMAYVEFEHEGMDCLVGIKPAGRYAPPRLALEIAHRLDFSLLIYSRGLKPLATFDPGYFAFKTGDSSFDDNYLCKSRGGARAKEFMTEPGRAVLLDQFMRFGFASIKVEDGVVMALKPFHGLGSSRDGLNAYFRAHFFFRRPQGEITEDVNSARIKTYLDQMRRVFIAG